MSSRMYEKIKQAASMLASDPRLRNEVKKVRKMMELLARIDEIRERGDGLDPKYSTIG